VAQTDDNSKLLTEDQILNTLDGSGDGSFISLGHPYSYLIDVRINVFRSDNQEWAIAIERLGYNPRAGAIVLEIFYYGNCLTNLEIDNNKATNYYSVYPIDQDKFESTTDGENLTIGAQSWLVRGNQLLLSHNKEDYTAEGIELKEYEPNQISIEEAARLLVIQYSNIFRATDTELYKSIPLHLKRILVLDKWYHKDFMLFNNQSKTDAQLKEMYNFNKNLSAAGGISFEEFSSMVRQQEISNYKDDKEMWDMNRPSRSETWQQLAKVIVTNTTTFYKPTLQPNTHWINWPDSGSL